MGLFKKKKLTKKEKETLEKAREELKKIKENRDDFDVSNNITSEFEKIKEKYRGKQNKDLEKLDQKEEEKILASTGKTYEYTNQTGMCCASNCDVPESVLNGKECKFCDRFCCIDHLLCHKHDCVIDM